MFIDDDKHLVGRLIGHPNRTGESKMIKSKDDLEDWASSHLETQVEVIAIQHAKLGGVILTPVLDQSGDKRKKIAGPEYMLSHGLWYNLPEDELSTTITNELTELLRDHPNVLGLNTGVDLLQSRNTLMIIIGLDVLGLFFEEPIAFQVAMSRLAQQRLLDSRILWDEEASTSAPERLQVLFDGMIYMSVVDTPAPVYNSVHGQVCREFLYSVFQEPVSFRREFSMSPTPLRQEFHLVYVRTPESEETGSRIPIDPIIESDTQRVFAFLSDASDRPSRLRYFLGW